MKTLTMLAMIGGAVLVAAPAAAETWTRFSASEAVAYLVDQDMLIAVDGVVAARFARVPTHGEAGNLSYKIEELSVRCSDGQSRSTATISFGPDGAETDRETDDAPWEDTPSGGVYGAMKSFACDDMRPQGQAYPTIQAFIEAGRGR